MSFPGVSTRRRTWTRTSLVLAAALLAVSPLALVAQRRNPGANPTATEANTDLVKILPARTGQKAEILKRGKSAPKPLSNGELQKLANEVLASLQQQSKIMPNADLAMLPVRKGGNVMTLSSFSSPIVLTPSAPILPGGSLFFQTARYVYAASQNAVAEWGIGNLCCQSLTTFVNASSGKTYLLDYTVDATSKFDVFFPTSGTDLQMSATQGHLLVPFLATSGGTFEVELSSSGGEGWSFYSVQIHIAS